MGQALSIRPDLLSLAYLEELQTLQDRVPPFSTVEAQRIIAEGLGRDPSALFSNMSPEPVAAASLGQVILSSPYFMNSLRFFLLIVEGSSPGLRFTKQI